MTFEAMFSQYETWREANGLARASVGHVWVGGEGRFDANSDSSDESLSASARLPHNIRRPDRRAFEEFRLSRLGDPLHQAEHVSDEFVDDSRVIERSGGVCDQPDDHVHLHHRNSSFSSKLFAVVGHWLPHVVGRIKAAFRGRVE